MPVLLGPRRQLPSTAIGAAHERAHPVEVLRMLYMVIEAFRSGNPVPVYQRLKDRGRSIPAGIEYLGSWVTEDLGRCYQVMSCDERSTLDDWIAAWADLVDFDVIPVITSAEAQATVARRLV